MPRPLEDYLEIRTAHPAGFSTDGSRLLVESNLPGTMQLYRLALDGGELVQLTSFAEPVSGGYIPESDRLVMSMDSGGNERLQLYLAVDEPDPELVPLAVDPDHIHRTGGVTRDGTLLAYASNAANGKDFDVYVRPVDPAGEARVVFAMGGWCQPAGFSPDGRWLAVSRLTEKAGDNDLYLVDLTDDSVVHVSPHDDEARFSGPSWLPDSSAFFFSTDTGRDLAAIARYDVEARSWELVLEDEWDLGAALDWEGRRLIVSANRDGYTELRLHDPSSLERVGTVALPEAGVVAARARSKDGRWLAYSLSAPREPGDVWLQDLDSDEPPRRLTSMPRAVPAEEMVVPELHRIASFDGERIPVFLYRPRDDVGDSGDVPAIVHVHGGPESQYVPAFNPLIQWFVAAGYAVAAPNVRGSTGYGKRYEHLDDVRRRLDSVADLAALHDWLAATPGLDAERAALMGGSYGGYMVLAGLTFQPERWAAGVSVVGISSLVTFLENTSVWRRAFREREYGSLEHDRDFLHEVSPLTHVDNIRVPLMLIHGANDPRVPLSEAEQVHAAVQAKGIRTELLVYPDEGHGLAKLANRLDAYPKAVAFLDEILRPGR